MKKILMMSLLPVFGLAGCMVVPVHEPPHVVYSPPRVLVGPPVVVVRPHVDGRFDYRRDSRWARHR